MGQEEGPDRAKDQSRRAGSGLRPIGAPRAGGGLAKLSCDDSVAWRHSH